MSLAAGVSDLVLGPHLISFLSTRPSWSTGKKRSARSAQLPPGSIAEARFFLNGFQRLGCSRAPAAKDARPGPQQPLKRPGQRPVVQRTLATYLSTGENVLGRSISWRSRVDRVHIFSPSIGQSARQPTRTMTDRLGRNELRSHWKGNNVRSNSISSFFLGLACA